MADESRSQTAREEKTNGGGTRKPDSDVGSRGPAPAGGGHQTPEQAAITGTGSSGLSDADRSGDWGGEAGTTPPAVGGSSGGHSDRKAAGGPRAGEPVAPSPDRAKRDGA